MTNRVNNYRIEWIDISKGFGIILVIWGHIAINDGPVNIWISSFHMPLFFFLSGFVFKNEGNFRDFFIHKFKANILLYFKLIIPIIIFTNIMAMYQGSFSIYDLLYMIKRSLIQDRYLVLWFLPCLFWLNISLFVILKITKSRLLATSIIVAFSALIGLSYYKCGGTPLPWDIDAATTALPFFFAGYICKLYRITFCINYKPVIKMAIIFLSCIAMQILLTSFSYAISGEVLNINDCKYGVIPLSFTAAFLGILATVILSNISHPKITRYIGRNSIVFFAWHNDIMKHIVNRFLKTFNLIYNENWDYSLRMLYWAANVILIIIGLAICNEVLHKIKTMKVTKI